MNRIFLTILVVVSSLLFSIMYGAFQVELKEVGRKFVLTNKTIELPEPKKDGEISVEEALQKRRSIRDYLDKPLRLNDLSQILWAAQGITEPIKKFRTAPSAGATYPLEVYVVVKNVEGLEKGVYHYNPFKHNLELIKKGNFSYRLYEACLNQEWVLKAQANIIITAFYERTTNKYGERGIRYVHMEAGHVGQNIYLQATTLGVGTVAIGAFYDDKVEEIIDAEVNEKALYVYPLGYRR
ncbi:nitroreductase [Archaeoglobales archaeon]|nr:MAG: nitroreductase [Archaeoglobales archaeon]